MGAILPVARLPVKVSDRNRMGRAMKRVARGKYVLVPASERTRGHASFYDAGLNGSSDHVIGLLQDRLRDGDPESLCGF